MRSLYFKIFLWFWLAMALVGFAFVVSTATLQRSEAEARWRSFVASGLTASGHWAIEAYRTRGREGLVQFLERMERRSEMRAYLFDAALNELSGRPVPDGAVDVLSSAVNSDQLAVASFEGSRLVALRLTAPEDGEYVLLADMEWPFRSRDRYERRLRQDGAGRDEADRSVDAPAPSTAERGDTDRPSAGSGTPSAERPVGAADVEDDGERRGRGGRSIGFRRGPSRQPPPWYTVWLSAIDQPGSLALRMAAILLTAGALCYGLARYLTAPVLRLRDATHRIAGGDFGFRVGPAVANRRDELAELGRDFDAMAERIESLLLSQRQLLRDVSHELRSPLARLNVALALARQRSGPEAEAPLARIESEAEQLNSLIGRVLALARLESGGQQVGQAERAEVDLKRLVLDVAADADFEADPRSVSVVVSSTVPCAILGGEALLRSAIENVVRNAVRYTAAGTEVEISLAVEGGDAVADGTGDSPTAGVPRRAVIEVRDHGPGVPDDQLEKLFEPFYRIADARDRQSGGTGLGLSITRRAVRLHGGVVSAANVEDGGLRVRIVLPLG